MSDINYPESVDKIQDFVTRPREPVKDTDGKGHYSISPLGFPNTNVSGDSNPTRITPVFKATYKDARNYQASNEGDYSEEEEIGVIRNNYAQSGGTSTTIVLDINASNITDFYKYNSVRIISGSGLGEVKGIVSYNALTKEATVDSAWVSIPDGTSQFIILVREELVVSANPADITLDANANPNDDVYNGFVVRIVSGTGIGQSRIITDYDGISKTAIIDKDWVVIPDNTSTYILIQAQKYLWDGTENDNKLGVYLDDNLDPKIDPITGKEINHLRKTYSDIEVSNYLRLALDPTFRMGRADDGTLFKWLMGTRPLSIGSGPASTVIPVEPFGANRISCIPRTTGPVDLRDRLAVSRKRKELRRHQRHTNWLLSNTHNTDDIYKSTALRDYPSVYNSEYIPERINFAQSGTANTIILDVGASSTDSVYNTNTIEILSGTGFGQVRTILGYTGATREAEVDADWQVIPDSTSEFRITNITMGSNLLYNSLDLYRISVNNSVTPDLQPLVFDSFFYQRDNSYHNNITLDLDEKTMYGRHHIAIAHTFNIDEEFNFTFTDKKKIVDQLDLIDPQIIRKEVDGTIQKYYYKRRKKRSISDFAAFPSMPTSTGVQYELDFPNPGDLTIHLDPGTNNLDYTFSSGNFTAAQKLTHVQDNHDMIPDVISPTEVTYNLEALFTHNTIIDLVDPDNIFRQKKVRSKKTFVHLPTKNISDGAVFELDVSLPQDQGDLDFVNNTIGVLSGYRNYITQPRLYVFSGYDVKVGDTCNLPVGTTEKKNPYLFSPNPEVEYARNGSGEPETANIFHQRRMENTDIFGNRFVRKMIFQDAGYTDVIDSDIGKVVLGSTSGDRSILLNFDNANKTWIIRLVDGAQYNIVETITIIDGVGTGDLSGAVVDPEELDKRVLIATVYPTSTNTFGWRMDNDPSFRLMHWSILCNSQYYEGATYLAYKRNKQITSDILAISGEFAQIGLFDFGLREFPLSYKNDFLSLGDFAQYISSHIRLLYAPKLIPEHSGDLISESDAIYASHSKQCSKAFNELMRDFYKSRVRLNLRSSMSSLDTEPQQIGFNNSTMVVPPAPSDDYSNGFMTFTNTEFPDNASGNAQRWMTKAKDLPRYIVHPPTIDHTINVFGNSSTAFKNYMEPYFIPGKETESDAANMYIPGTLYPTIFPSYEYGAGFVHHLVTNLVNAQSRLFDFHILDPDSYPTMINDLRRRLWQSSFDIDYFDSTHPGANRKFDRYEFTSSIVNDETYFRKFYGMLWSPFARVVDLNSVIPKEYAIESTENLDVIKANSVYDPVQRTLINYVKSNPAVERFYRLRHQTSDGKSLDTEHMKMSKIVGIHDSVTDLAPSVPDFFNNTKDDFLKNYITPHSNKMTNRYFNSYRILLTGSASASGMYGLSDGVENFDNERTFKTMAYSYLNNVVDTPEIHTAVDDHHLLLDDGGLKVKAEDFNLAWTFFDKGTGSRSNTAQNATSNTIVLDGSASSVNDFYKDNVIKIFSGTGAGQARTIVAYDGSTKTATVDFDWVTIPDNTSLFAIDTQVKSLINVNGQQFVFKKGFYDSKGKRSYIRVKMKFIYSKKMGRWVTLDYRQSPMTYLTPTFGNVALSRKEKTTVFPGLSGQIKAEYVPFILPDTNSTISTYVRQNNRNILEYTVEYPSAILAGESNVIAYIQKIPNLQTSPQDPSKYVSTKLLHNIVNHNINADEWSDQNVNYSVNTNVVSRGVIYRVAFAHTSTPSTKRPEYNGDYQVRQAPVLYAPYWSEFTRYSYGDYVRFGDSIYMAVNTTMGNPDPSSSGNFTFIVSLTVDFNVWQSGTTYNKEDRVGYNGIIYEVTTPSVIGAPAPDTNPNYSVYSRFVGYAQDWDPGTQYNTGDYVFYNYVSYKVISGSPLGGLSPDQNGQFAPIHESYSKNPYYVELDMYTFILRDAIPTNFDYTVYLAPSINTISSLVTPYPWNSINGSVYRDYLWQHEDSKCIASPVNTPYYKLKPMKLNRFCIPFLSNKLPYDEDGNLLSFLNGEHDQDLNTTFETDPGPSQFEDYSETPQYNITAVHVTENNGSGIDRDIWISTNGPVSKGVKRKTGGPVDNNYSSLVDLQVATGDGAVRKDATGIDTDLAGNVYFAAKKLVRTDPNGTSFSVVTGVANLVTPPTQCTKLYVDKGNGLIFVVGSDGFFVYDIAADKWVKKFNSGNSILHPSGATDLHQGPDATVWIISTSAGDAIYKYNYPNNALTQENTVFGAKHQLVKACVRVHGNGDVFVAGYTQGLYPSFSRRDSGTGQWIITDLPTNATPYALIQDYGNNMWLGTYKGLFKFISDGNFEIFDDADGMHFDGDLVNNGNIVYSISPDSDNNLWLGGFGGILYFRRYMTTTYADYTLRRLANPHQNEANGGINFVVPNNLSGGKGDTDAGLYLFQPHMFKVYWHIRPVVSAYHGTDIPTYSTTQQYSGFAPTANSNDIQLDGGASGVTGAYVNSVIYVNSGVGAGQIRKIIAYDGGTKIATVDRNWDVIPNDGFASISIFTNPRMGGQISDPCLGNMFNFPRLPINTDYLIPWHSDMSKNWYNDDAFVPIPPNNIIDIDENDAEDEIDENGTCEGGNDEIIEV